MEGGLVHCQNKKTIVEGKDRGRKGEWKEGIVGGRDSRREGRRDSGRERRRKEGRMKAAPRI
jgi:hypothetical protein